jgi:hypothetical protein
VKISMRAHLQPAVIAVISATRNWRRLQISGVGLVLLDTISP